MKKLRVHMVIAWALCLSVQACGVQEFVSDKLGITKKDNFTETGPCDMLTTNPEWLDSDGDGLSDQCELAIGYDPYDNDSDQDGIGDGLDTSPPCTLSAEECANFDDQRKNALTRQGVGKDAMLASSALKGKNPVGTEVHVSKQNFRVVLTENGVSKGWPSDPTTKFKMMQFCTYDPTPSDTDTKDNIPMQNFIYASVEGTVKLCTAVVGGSQENSSCEGETTQTSIELCGPLDGIANPIILSNFAENTEYTISDFRWTAAAAGSLSGKKFNPQILFTKKNAPSNGSNTLTLTPKDQKTDPNNASNKTFNKLVAKFTYPWKVAGTIEQQIGGYVYSYSMPQVSGIESENITIKNMKRTDTIDFAQTPSLVGPYTNDKILDGF
ncbi:MAG: thrombospondin type 3 repeat-containing protein [Bdellovibrionota bacterium]